jgi:hypothetical protein
MAHWAKVNNGIVEQVIVADAEFFNTFVDTSPGSWIQTSYNTKGGVHYDPNTNEPSADQSKALRKNYATVGCAYDVMIDAFIPPKPYPSWIINPQTCLWEAPIPYPEDGKYYEWDEQTKSWKEINPNV